MKYQVEETNKFVERMKALGYKVFVAKSGTYGFVTDDKKERVLSFQFDGLESSLSGNYGPPSTESGTGWRLQQTPEQLVTAEDVHKALYAHPDYNVSKGWKRFTTVKEHLAMYGSSSQYQEV